MAYGKTFATSEDIYPLKVLDYFEEVRRIRDGEQKLQAVIDGETFLWIFLEGSPYEESKKQLYALIEDRKKEQGQRPFDALNKANALVKLQQREAKAAKIYGETGLVLVLKKEKPEETQKVLKELALEAAEPGR
jgi:hypothetical protein